MPAFRATARLFIDRELSADARGARLAAFAEADVAAMIADGRASATFQRWVDGQEGKPPEAVRDVIFYRFSYLPAALAFALAFLRARSPVESGRFRDAWFAAIDGNFVPAGMVDPITAKGAGEVLISNTEPYERKVDVQFAGGHALRYSVPAQMLTDCSLALRSKYGSILQVRRLSNVRFPGQYVLKRGFAAGSPVQSPALSIQVVE